jgi:LysM repeat protein
MNNPSPFVPQGSITEQKNKTRARVRTVVSFILAIHVIGLVVLLMQGCRKPAEETGSTPAPDTNAAPTFDTNTAPMLEDTNTPSTNTSTAYIPPAPVETNPPPIVTPPAVGQDYAIVKGDTFAGLSKKFGVSVKAIQQANPGVDPKKLKVNQKIHIPPPTATSVGTMGNSAPAPTDVTASGEQVYKVKSGDTLTTIAKHFGVSVKAIRSANNLTTDKIKVGDKLKIPGKATAPAPAPATESVPATNPGA